MSRRILFMTSEMADYVKVGGLGEVSAALPRALAKTFDIRVLIPGYREVVERHPEITIVSELPSVAGLPACHLGYMRASENLGIYVLLSSH